VKIVYYLISLLFFIGAYRTYITRRYDIKHGTYLELGSYTIYISIILILIGIYFIYLAKNMKKREKKGSGDNDN